MLKTFIRRQLERVLHARGYRLVADNTFDWPSRDAEFQEIFALQARFGGWERGGPKVQRMYMIRNLIMSLGGKDGDWAECGTFKGSTALVMAEYARRYNLLREGRKIHIFDSFEGLSAPTAEDHGTRMADRDFAADESVVRANLAPYDCFEFHRCWIPERFSDVADREFAFVHIDVDLYEPVRDSLGFFLPLMVPGGIVALDDYGCAETPGALKATDEIAAKFGRHVVRLPYGQAFVLA